MHISITLALDFLQRFSIQTPLYNLLNISRWHNMQTKRWLFRAFPTSELRECWWELLLIHAILISTQHWFSRSLSCYLFPVRKHSVLRVSVSPPRTLACSPSLAFPAVRVHLWQKVSHCEVLVWTATVKKDKTEMSIDSPGYLRCSCVKTAFNFHPGNWRFLFRNSVGQMKWQLELKFENATNWIPPASFFPNYVGQTMLAVKSSENAKYRRRSCNAKTWWCNMVDCEESAPFLVVN